MTQPFLSSQESAARHEGELGSAVEAAKSEAAAEVRARMEAERERALRAQAERLERRNKQVRLLSRTELLEDCDLSRLLILIFSAGIARLWYSTTFL